MLKWLLGALFGTLFVAAVGCGAAGPSREQSQVCITFVLVERSMAEFPDQPVVTWHAATEERLEHWTSGRWVDSSREFFAVPYTYDGSDYEALGVLVPNERGGADVFIASVK